MIHNFSSSFLLFTILYERNRAEISLFRQLGHIRTCETLLVKEHQNELIRSRVNNLNSDRAISNQI